MPDRAVLTQPAAAPRVEYNRLPRIVLAGDICRADLLIEADCVHSGSFAS